MTDIELVIKIPEEKLSLIKNKRYCGLYDSDLYKAIANGILLPKGHGRLIDVKQIVTEVECIWNSDGSCTTITTYDIDSTPTIIEADMERNEDDNN